MSHDLREALDAAQVTATEHHCLACALVALTESDEDEVVQLIAYAANSAVHVITPGGKKASRRDAAAAAFVYGVLTGRALAIRGGPEL